MNYRARRLTHFLKTHDPELYARDDGQSIKVYRRCKEFRLESLGYETPVLNLVRNDHLVMSLTDTWGVKGKRVDWGIEPVMARIKALDLWNSNNLADQFFKEEEEHEKQKAKDFSNNVESFLYDFRSQFKKATSDINTSNLNKFDKRKLGDNKLWQS